MGRFKKLVKLEEAMEKFVADYKIPDNVGLRYCKEGDWHIMRQEGEVVIPIIAFLEGGMRLPMCLVVRDYLKHFRLVPIQCAVNMFRILGSVDALNEQMGLRLTHHDVNWCSPVPQGQNLLHEGEGRKGPPYSVSPRVQQGSKQGLPYHVGGVARRPTLPS